MNEAIEKLIASGRFGATLNWSSTYILREVRGYEENSS